MTVSTESSSAYPGDAASGDERVDAQCAPDAQERISKLLEAMSSQRKLLVAAIKRCDEPCPAKELIAFIDEGQQFNRSVYDAANICALLEREGAIERVTADGRPFGEVVAEPQVVVVDGVEYLEVPESEEACWVATQAGLAVAAADDPRGRLDELFGSDAVYLPIYRRILELCDADGGASAQAIASAVDSDPLLEKPRLFSGHFVERLELCEAIEWRNSWVVTDVGRSALDALQRG